MWLKTTVWVPCTNVYGSDMCAEGDGCVWVPPSDDEASAPLMYNIHDVPSKQQLFTPEYMCVNGMGLVPGYALPTPSPTPCGSLGCTPAPLP
jgi:hypothetical protein